MGKEIKLTFLKLFGLTFLLQVALINQTAQAQKDSAQDKAPIAFPTPTNVPSQLFYLQRDPNANTVIYALNLTNGQLDKDEPVHGFWIRYAEQKQQKELSYIQRKFAYGLKVQQMPNNEYELRFVSYKKLPLYLVKSDRTPGYYVYVQVNQKKIILKRVYLHIEGGSFWVPNVKYIQHYLLII